MAVLAACHPLALPQPCLALRISPSRPGAESPSSLWSCQMTFKLQDAALPLIASPRAGREEQVGAQLQLNAPGVQGLALHWAGPPLSPQILSGGTGVLWSWPEEQLRSPSPSHHGPVPSVRCGMAKM